jgi:hypothetical protein
VVVESLVALVFLYAVGLVEIMTVCPVDSRLHFVAAAAYQVRRILLRTLQHLEVLAKYRFCGGKETLRMGRLVLSVTQVVAPSLLLQEGFVKAKQRRLLVHVVVFSSWMV